MNLFGDRLIAWRERKGMVQEALASASDVSVSTISRLEGRIDDKKREIKPNLNTKRKLAKGLGIDVEDLDRMPPPIHGNMTDEELLANKDKLFEGLEMLAAKGDVSELDILRKFAEWRSKGIIK